MLVIYWKKIRNSGIMPNSSLKITLMHVLKFNFFSTVLTRQILEISQYFKLILFMGIYYKIYGSYSKR